MNKINDNYDVIPLEDLMIELFDNRDDVKHIQAIEEYVFKNKYSYSLVSLYSVLAIADGYKILKK